MGAEKALTAKVIKYCYILELIKGNFGYFLHRIYIWTGCKLLSFSSLSYSPHFYGKLLLAFSAYWGPASP
jgi:hypothetical protein